jgi:hypothetical protein
MTPVRVLVLCEVPCGTVTWRPDSASRPFRAASAWLARGSVTVLGEPTADAALHTPGCRSAPWHEPRHDPATAR